MSEDNLLKVFASDSYQDIVHDIAQGVYEYNFNYVDYFPYNVLIEGRDTTAYIQDVQESYNVNFSIHTMKIIIHHPILKRVVLAKCGVLAEAKKVIDWSLHEFKISFEHERDVSYLHKVH